MRVPEHCLLRLRSSGLLISDPFVPTHLAYPDGVQIGKPAAVPGNAIPDYKGYWGSDKVLIDAPGLVLYADESKWRVVSHDIIPGPGVGDFLDEWDTPEEAVDDILDFYFGDPRRMEVKRRRRDECGPNSWE